MATIKIGAKNFTEEFILGELYAQLLENNGFKVERKLNLGATPIAHQALVNKEIDLHIRSTPAPACLTCSSRRRRPTSRRFLTRLRASMRRIDELLNLIGLPREYRRRFPRQLSGGEQQRVGIARALAADPATMLMDEPFGAIDAITRARLQDELLALQRKLHKTILFVTHDVDEALRLADRIIVMRDGRIVQFDSPLHILTRPADEFVARLVDAGDTLRQLSLLTVGAVASPLDGRHIPGTTSVASDTDVRSALALLLSSEAEVLPVADDDGRLVGGLLFEDVRRAVTKARA